MDLRYEAKKFVQTHKNILKEKGFDITRIQDIGLWMWCGERGLSIQKNGV
jgi:hypothetical protein